MRFLYHAFSDAPGLNTCSAYSDEAPLVVNCAGNIVMEKPFTTHNTVGREDYYLMYITKGSINADLGGEESVAGAGDVLLFPPHYRYRYSHLGGGTLEYLFVHFTGSYADSFLERLGLLPLPLLYRTENDFRIAESFRKLIDYTEGSSPFKKYELASVLEGLLLILADTVIKKAPTRTLEASLHMIHTSYHENLKIPELAKIENLSHSRYVELFRRQMGMSPMAYLIKLRMQAACSLLENTDIPVRRIARMVSYDDPHFFSKLFKRHVGVSPSEYREGRV